MRVRFEPIGEEIDCAARETVLDAAFRQGYNLVYGCREGQCSACKCFLLEGDAALKRYSNFALSDSERSAGYSLMCRAMPEQDLVIELLHYDPDGYRLEHPIRDGTATVEAVEPLTHDIVRLLMRVDEPSDFSFIPGQYVDVWVPGADGARRSFSIANRPGDGRIELMIKRYPGGRLSGMLDGEIALGAELRFTGPYGAFRIRESERPILMIAGGSGMAPILCVLRQLSADGCARPVRFFYGARTERDLFWTDEIARLGERLADFTFTPVTGRLVHDVVDESLAAWELSEPDVYMCGPPPMLEAAQEMLIAKHKLDEQRIFMDRFTASAASADALASEISQSEISGASAKAIGDGDSEREFSWFAPAARRASLYEDVTIDTQPSVHRHLTRAWPVSFEDGRGTWNDASTALASTDWFAFRDPGELWERPFYQRGAAIEQQIEGAMRSAIDDGLVGDYDPDWVELLRKFLQVPAYVEHGLWFALATIARDCLSDSVATCVCLQAAMKQRSAQAIVLYAMDLEQHHGPFPIEDARETFLRDPPWQPTRRYLERLAASTDWGEVIVAANVCFEPIVGTLLRRELGIRAAAARGDTVTPVLARAASQEWKWTRGWTTGLIARLIADTRHGTLNRSVLSEWVREWQPLALQAATAIGEGVGIDVDVEALRADADAILAEAAPAGPTGAAGPAPPDRRLRPAAAAPRSVPTAVPAAANGPRSVPTAAPAAANGPRPVPTAAPAPANGSYDYVGIVMAKSAEGDAVAEILGRREGIEVIEQPAFWEIRAKVRLAIQYAEVSEQLGYEIDAYSIQHEMSTHYARMVVTDDSLMLFSDPTEAMQYLIS